MTALWETLSPPWRACIQEAWSAYLEGSRPIGAVVVTSTGEVVSRGRNSTWTRLADMPQETARLAHAELIALMGINHEADVSGHALYTTTEPCPLCIGALRISGVRELRFARREAWSGSVELLTASAYMRQAQITVIGPDLPALETILTAMHAVFSLEMQPDRARPVLDAWRRADAKALSFAESLLGSGQLLRLREARVSTEEAISALEIALAADSEASAT